MTSDDRAQALRDVIDFVEPIDQKIEHLRSFSWDSDAPLLILSRGNVTSMLDRYLNGTVGATDLEKWADAIEGRDDIGYADTDRDVLRQIIFELANPLLTKAISKATVLQWKIDLQGAE